MSTILIETVEKMKQASCCIVVGQHLSNSVVVTEGVKEY
jgi:hypothetical protein